MPAPVPEADRPGSSRPAACRLVGVYGHAGSGVGTLATALDPQLPADLAAFPVPAGRLEDVLPLAGAYDLLLVVISARQGAAGVALAAVEAALDAGVPVVVAVTALDDARVDLDEVVAVCERVLPDGPEVIALTLPLLADPDPTLLQITAPSGPLFHDAEPQVAAGLVDVLTARLHTGAGGPPDGAAVELADHREALADCRADLADLVLPGHPGDPTEAELVEALRQSVGEGSVLPVFGVVGRSGLGVAPLARVLSALTPPAWSHLLAGWPDGEPVVPAGADPADRPAVALVLAPGRARVYSGAGRLGAVQPAAAGQPLGTGVSERPVEFR